MKPDLQIFEFAVGHCGHSRAHGGWMIGDNPSGDKDGGQQVDVRTTWLRVRS